MKGLFKPIRDIKNVKGVILLSSEGDCLYKTLAPELIYNFTDDDWKSYIIIFNNIQEAELVFTNLWLYVRKCQAGYLMVIAGKQVSPPLVRLSCDMVIPDIQHSRPEKTWRQIFKLK